MICRTSLHSLPGTTIPQLVPESSQKWRSDSGAVTVMQIPEILWSSNPLQGTSMMASQRLFTSWDPTVPVRNVYKRS